MFLMSYSPLARRGVAPVLAAGLLGLGAAQYASAQVLPLVNPSFELPDVTPDPNDPNNPFNGVSPFVDGWVKSGPTSPIFFVKADTGVFYNVPAGGYPAVGNADGNQLAFIGNNVAADGSTEGNPLDDSGDFVSLMQESTATLELDTVYAFTIGLGPSVTSPPDPGAEIELAIGYVSPLSGNFATLASLTLDAGDLKDPNALLTSDPTFSLLKDFTVLLPSIPTDGPAGNEIAVRARISNPTTGGGNFILDNARLVQVIPGDTDFDGDVDDADLGTAFANYTGPGGTPFKGLAEGDTDFDGDVDDADIGATFANYTGPNPQVGVAIPEPTSLAIMALGAALGLRRRR